MLQHHPHPLATIVFYFVVLITSVSSGYHKVITSLSSLWNLTKRRREERGGVVDKKNRWWIDEKETKETQETLSSLKTSQLVKVKLKPSFCEYLKQQRQDRYDPEDLNNGWISGVVLLSVFRRDVGCYVLEVLTAKKTSDGVIKKVYCVLGDEVETIHSLG